MLIESDTNKEHDEEIQHTNYSLNYISHNLSTPKQAAITPSTFTKSEPHQPHLPQVSSSPTGVHLE